MTENLTFENFKQETGFRFRIKREQKERIDAGDLTREGAFQEFLESGGLERLQGRPISIPDSVYQDPNLTLENFAATVKVATGSPRRFRVSREQFARITDGSLTREQALAEDVAAKRVIETPTQEPELV